MQLSQTVILLEVISSLCTYFFLILSACMQFILILSILLDFLFASGYGRCGIISEIALLRACLHGGKTGQLPGPAYIAKILQGNQLYC